MNDFAPLLRAALDEGASFEMAMARLKAAGADPVPTIKAIREVTSVSLAEAKLKFDASPTWRIEAEAGRRLHEEILRGHENDGGDGQAL